MASIANYFNPSGTATDDIMQLKALADSNNGDLDSVINDQLISKYGSLEKLYEVYQSEQNNTFTNETDALAFYNKQNPNQSALTPIEETDIGQAMGQRMEGIPRTRVINPHQMGLQENYSNMPVINPKPPSALPNEDNLYDENIARLIAQNQGQSEADILASQPDFRGQLQAMVDQSGSGGTVEYASHKTDDDREDKSLVDSILGIVKMPWEAAKGLYDITGEATHGVIDTFSDPAKFKSKLQDPRVQAGLRTVYEMGTPSFSSPFAKVSKALLDTSTYLSAADEAKAAASKKGTVKSSKMLYIPGQNKQIDDMLRLMNYSGSEAEGNEMTYYDFLVGEQQKNRYSDISLRSIDGVTFGIDTILTPHDMSKYKDITWENYNVGDDTKLDTLLSESWETKLKENVKAGGTSKIIAETGPQKTISRIKSINLDGLDYTHQEGVEEYNSESELGKLLKANGYDFKDGERIRVEGWVAELGGKTIWGDIIAAAPAKEQDLNPNETKDIPAQKNANEQYLEFKKRHNVSKDSANNLATATAILGTLDSPTDSLGLLQTIFQPLANITDRMFGDSGFGIKIKEALQGDKNAFKVREEVGALLKNLILPKLKALYPVSNKDVVFLEESQPNLSSKSFFKLSSFYQGVYGFDELVAKGVREWDNELIKNKETPGWYYSQKGVEFEGTTYRSAMDYAEAYAKSEATKLYQEALKGEDGDKIRDVAALYGYKDANSPLMKQVLKLGIINYVNSEESRAGQAEEIAKLNYSSLNTLFKQSTAEGSPIFTQQRDLATAIMGKRFAIDQLYRIMVGKGYDEEKIDKNLGPQIEDFESAYGITYAADYNNPAWLGVEKNPESYYSWILNDDLGGF
jgi:hypothetical protein